HTSMQSLRWLFYDKRFENYETIYIGDIDILIFRENKDIYSQHMEHCDVIELPYSNYIRLSTDYSKLTLKMFFYYLITKQFRLLNKKIKNEPIVENRLTGLHFVKQQEYY